MTSDFLNEVVARKAKEVAQCAASRPLPELRALIESSSLSVLPPPRGFIHAMETEINNGRAAVIAEIKKASPSAGMLRKDFDPATIASDFAEHGATCLSVLTDSFYFQGDAGYINQVRAACDLPVLRKDFIIDPYQVYESRWIGADAILLIAAVLSDSEMSALAELATSLNLDVLLEVHDELELKRALATPCRLIGVNNRNLRTLKTDLETTLTLRGSIPENRIVVTESGLRERADVLRMQQNDVHAFLIGETLMRAPAPGKKLQSLFAEE